MGAAKSGTAVRCECGSINATVDGNHLVIEAKHHGQLHVKRYALGNLKDKGSGGSIYPEPI